MSFQVLMDVAIPRRVKDRLVVSASGTNWEQDASIASFTDVVVDEVTATLALRPYCSRPEWTNTFSGNYARLAKAAYTLITPGAWYENHRAGSGDIFLENRGVNEIVYTTATYSKNRGFYVSWFSAGGEKRAVEFECGWGTAGASDTVSLFFWSNGTIEIFKGTARVGTGSITTRRRLKFEGKKNVDPRNSGGKTDPNSYREVILQPWRRRELGVLPLTSEGGFSHVFTDLDPDVVNAITKDNAPFWWRVPSGKASVQCAPLTFPASGVAYSPVNTLRYPPEVIQNIDSYSAWDAAGAGTTSAAFALTKADGSAYVPDGIIDEVRIKATLTGDGSYTPQVYAADVVVSGTSAETDDSEEFDITPYLLEASLTVEDGIEPATLTVVCHSPDAMETAGLAAPLYQENRPIKMLVDGVPLFRGSTMGRPSWTEGMTDANRRVTWACQDELKQTGTLRYTDPLAFDGLIFTDEVENIITDSGYDPAELDVQSDAFLLPYTTAVSQDEWILRPESGGSALEWLTKLHQDFAGTWIGGWYPTAAGRKFRFRSEADLGDTPVVTIYGDGEDPELVAALLAGGMSADDVIRNRHKYVFRKGTWKEDPQPIAATRIYVTGFDPRRGVPIFDEYIGAAAEDPTLAPSARPAGVWYGEPLVYGIQDPIWTTTAAVTRVKDILTAQLTIPFTPAEWGSDLLFHTTGGAPVWKGDVVRQPGYGDYRVLSLSCTFKQSMEAPGLVWRDAHYVGKYIGDGEEEE